MEDYYDNIVSYWPLVTSHQLPIDYIEPRSKSTTEMDTPSGRPAMITPDTTPQCPDIIPLDEESIYYQHPLPPSLDIDFLPQPLTKVQPTEPSDATLHKNSM